MRRTESIRPANFASLYGVAVSFCHSKRRSVMDHEIESFQKDLLASVRQMKAGKTARTTEVKLSTAAEARAKVGVSQRAFAQLLGVSLRTLQDWEQGRRRPTGAAQTLLRVASQHPEALRDLQSI
ncbi:helix-turn-helix domain-containing protein [Pseudomonas sp. TH10]|uniref:helix-turn-helix domain-containing protein n=1 Tax=Pseudomonas sp. TH10 TaxID=2796376 RepID=UPI0027DEA394|nr:helix-turn-helix domain-containing protein [Pseudomonas sp. TH10]